MVAADDIAGHFSDSLHTSGALQGRDEAVGEAAAGEDNKTALKRQVRSQARAPPIFSLHHSLCRLISSITPPRRSPLAWPLLTS